MKLLVTGGAGFIGSAFCRLAAARGHTIVVLDCLSYCGDTARLEAIKGRYAFYKGSIGDKDAVKKVMSKEKPQAIVNFAAETHVDRSINDASPFIDTNVKGTQVLLDACLSFPVKRFVHLSTDEVYGEIARGSFTEKSVINPNSPYSASKASADLLIRAYMRTFGLPAVIVRPSNNYGPWQYPEKLIPLMVKNALDGKRLPVYAKGLNRREWLYVDDCARGILAVLTKGATGEVYNIGSGQEERNIDVVRAILSILGKPESLIAFVKDRPGHDFRYSLDSSRIRRLGWKPQVLFRDGIRSTIAWCLEHRRWLNSKG